MEREARLKERVFFVLNGTDGDQKSCQAYEMILVVSTSGHERLRRFRRLVNGGIGGTGRKTLAGGCS